MIKLLLAEILHKLVFIDEQYCQRIEIYAVSSCVAESAAVQNAAVSFASRRQVPAAVAQLCITYIWSKNTDSVVNPLSYLQRTLFTIYTMRSLNKTLASNLTADCTAQQSKRVYFFKFLCSVYSTHIHVIITIINRN